MGVSWTDRRRKRRGKYLGLYRVVDACARCRQEHCAGRNDILDCRALITSTPGFYNCDAQTEARLMMLDKYRG